MSDPSGVVFPLDPTSGRRSTTATGRAVVADALRAVDPVGAASAERETNWRQGYLPHFRRLVEAGLARPGTPRRPSPRRASTRCTRGCAGRRRRATDPLDGRLRRADRQRRAAGHRDGPRRGRARPRALGAVCRRAPLGGRAAPPARPLGRRRHRRADLRRGGRPRHRQPRLARPRRTAPSSCSAPPPRWGRCARCCAGAPTSPPSTSPDRTCGTGCSATRDGCAGSMHGARAVPATSRSPRGPAPTWSTTSAPSPRWVGGPRRARW